MKWKYGLFLPPLIGMLIAGLLLLNITAPNPTGRRYSSEIVLTTGGPSAIGVSGERILSEDLGLPRNDIGSGRMCVYQAHLLPCTHSSQGYRPDFINERWIIDAKNRKELNSDYDQLTAFAEVAMQTGRSFWIYVRVDTVVDPVFVELTESTGGGVVSYFRVEGWQDPVDRIAQVILIGSILVIGGILIWLWLDSLPDVPEDPGNDQRGGTLDEAERFAKRAKERARAQSEKYRLN
ncbi:MAG: hypothetical protein MUF87_21325 [Anaerolineae bacterium]|nr:hypothetical protein [Anaerolineae bacterium]